MSILIEGMNIPKEGEYHMTLYVCDDGYAYVDVDLFPVDKDRFEAVPVPPHGWLIDADALASEMEKQISNQDELMEFCKSAGDTKNYFNSSKVQIGMVSFLRALNDSPTIIPEEEGEI